MWVFRIAFLKKKSIKRDLNREERPQYQTILNLNSNRKTNLTWSNEMERPAGMKAALASSLEDIREYVKGHVVGWFVQPDNVLGYSFGWAAGVWGREYVGGMEGVRGGERGIHHDQEVTQRLKSRQAEHLDHLRASLKGFSNVDDKPRVGRGP
jgi:hypothetical protein